MKNNEKITVLEAKFDVQLREGGVVQRTVPNYSVYSVLICLGGSEVHVGGASYGDVRWGKKPTLSFREPETALAEEGRGAS